MKHRRWHAGWYDPGITCASGVVTSTDIIWHLMAVSTWRRGACAQAAARRHTAGPAPPRKVCRGEAHAAEIFKHPQSGSELERLLIHCAKRQMRVLKIRRKGLRRAVLQHVLA